MALDGRNGPEPPAPPPKASITEITVAPAGPYALDKVITVTVLGTPGGTAWWTLEVPPPPEPGPDK